MIQALLLFAALALLEGAPAHAGLFSRDVTPSPGSVTSAADAFQHGRSLYESGLDDKKAIAHFERFLALRLSVKDPGTAQPQARDPWVEQARFFLVMLHSRIALPEDRDDAAVRSALQEFGRLQDEELKNLAEPEAARMRALEARKNLLIADFYANREAWPAVAHRLSEFFTKHGALAAEEGVHGYLQSILDKVDRPWTNDPSKRELLEKLRAASAEPAAFARIAPLFFKPKPEPSPRAQGPAPSVPPDIKAAFEAASELASAAAGGIRARQAAALPLEEPFAGGSRRLGQEPRPMPGLLEFIEPRLVEVEDRGRVVARIRPDEADGRHAAALAMDLGFDRYSMGLAVDAGAGTVKITVSRTAPTDAEQPFSAKEIDAEALKLGLAIKGPDRELIRRGFGVTAAELDRIDTLSAVQALNSLLAFKDLPLVAQARAGDLDRSAGRLLDKAVKGESLDKTSLARLNRRLLEYLLPGALRPLPTLAWEQSTDLLMGRETKLELVEPAYNERYPYYASLKGSHHDALDGVITLEPAFHGEPFQATMRELMDAVFRTGKAVDLAGSRGRLFLMPNRDLSRSRSLVVALAGDCPSGRTYKVWAALLPERLPGGYEASVQVGPYEFLAADSPDGTLTLRQEGDAQPWQPDCRDNAGSGPAADLPEQLKTPTAFPERWKVMHETPRQKAEREIERYYTSRQPMKDMGREPMKVLSFSAYLLALQAHGQLVPRAADLLLRDQKRWVYERLGIAVEFVADDFLDPLEGRMGRRVDLPDDGKLRGAAFGGIDKGLASPSKTLDGLLGPVLPRTSHLVPDPEHGHDAVTDRLAELAENGMLSPAESAQLGFRHGPAPAGVDRLGLKVKPKLSSSNPGVMVTVNGPLRLPEFVHRLAAWLEKELEDKPGPVLPQEPVPATED